ncbi:MAG: hypothetical protein ACR2JW_14110 [Thermomicrobiales bacterium]
MSAKPPEQESVARQGCFISGVCAVLTLILLRALLFRLPPLGMIVLAGLLWLGFLVIYMRVVGGRRSR